VDWRNSVLIICFVIFTPYAWEYLAAFFSVTLTAGWFGGLPLGGAAEFASLSVILDSIVSSLFACLVIAIPCSVIANRSHLRNALIYTGLSTVHLTALIVLGDISVATIYWPHVSAEIFAFFVWLNLGYLAGVLVSETYRKYA
jgi:hypothetical protein